MELFRVLLLPGILCGFTAFVLGFFWYHPKILGRKWHESRQQDTEDRRRNYSTIPFSLSFMLWIIAGFFYSFIAMTFDIVELNDLVSLSCLLWVGFALPPLMMGSFYTGYPFRAATLDSAYQLAGYYLFALVYFASHSFLG